MNAAAAGDPFNLERFVQAQRENYADAATLSLLAASA